MWERWVPCRCPRRFLTTLPSANELLSKLPPPRDFPTELVEYLQKTYHWDSTVRFHGFPPFARSAVPTQVRGDAMKALSFTVDAVLKSNFIDRPPLCVNSGTTGSGKTEALRQAGIHFIRRCTRGHSIYVAFNGSHGSHYFDAPDPVSRRLAHRLLFAALDHKRKKPSFTDFITRLQSFNLTLVDAVAAVRTLLHMARSRSSLTQNSRVLAW